MEHIAQLCLQSFLLPLLTPLYFLPSCSSRGEPPPPAGGPRLGLRLPPHQAAERGPAGRAARLQAREDRGRHIPRRRDGLAGSQRPTKLVLTCTAQAPPPQPPPSLFTRSSRRLFPRCSLPRCQTETFSVSVGFCVEVMKFTPLKTGKWVENKNNNLEGVACELRRREKD